MGTISNITLGTLNLKAVNIEAIKVPGTKKQRVGKQLILHNVPEITVKDWQINITGELVGASASADRATLESYDDLSILPYSDGVHDGNYLIVTNSLRIIDNSSNVGQIIEYSFTLIQYQQ